MSYLCKCPLYAILCVMLLLVSCTKQEDTFESLNKRLEESIAHNRCDTAIALAQHTLEAAKRHYGENSSQTAQTLYILGELNFHCFHQYDLSLSYFTLSNTIRKTLYGEIDPGVANTYNYMGLVAMQAGDYSSKTEESLNKAITTWQILLQGDNTFSDSLYQNYMNAYAASLFNGGNYYFSIGDFQHALTLLKGANILYQKFGTDHLTHFFMLTKLGTLLLADSQVEEADTLSHFVLTLVNRNWGQNDTLYADALNLLGAVYLAKGNLDSAENRALEALQIDRKLGNTFRSLASYEILAELAGKKELYPKADSLLRIVTNIAKQEMGNNSTSVRFGQQLLKVGMINFEIGNYDEAQKNFMEALFVFNRTVGEGSPYTLLVKEWTSKISKNSKERHRGRAEK